MKTTKISLILIACILFVAITNVLTGCGYEYEEVNNFSGSQEVSIPNGDFESGSTIWTAGATSGTTYQYTITTDSHSGTNAGLLSIQNNGYCHIHNANEYFKIDHNGNYTLQFYGKITGSPTIQLTVWKSSSAIFPTTHVKSTNIVEFLEGYNILSLSGIPLFANEFVRFEIGIDNNSGAEAKLYIDDILLY